MKPIVLLILLTFFSVTSNAQGIDFGLKAGANFANLTDASELESKTGFLAGAFLAVRFNKFALQPELLYSQQGAKFDAGEFDLSYAIVPVILKYYLIKGLNLQVGPQFGFLVDDKISGVFGDIENQWNSNDFDFSGVIGAGYDFPMGIRVDARYNFGLNEVSEMGYKNTVISLALGYSFL